MYAAVFPPRTLKKRKHPHKINRKFASKKTYAVMFDLLFLCDSSAEKVLDNLLALVAKHTSPVRKGRVFSRPASTPAHSISIRRVSLS